MVELFIVFEKVVGQILLQGNKKMYVEAKNESALPISIFGLLTPPPLLHYLTAPVPPFPFSRCALPIPPVPPKVVQGVIVLKASGGGNGDKYAVRTAILTPHYPLALYLENVWVVKDCEV